jgi:Phage protein Gp138 N-terminal domain
MDPRERIGNLSLAMSTMIDGHVRNIWTALPVTIASYNAALQTASVRSMIIPGRNDPITGQKQILFPMPIINDCPVMFPGGGGFHLTFPIAVGDEGLLILATRQIDGWWATGNASQPSDLRMHDLSDGFVMVGVSSKPKAISGVNTTAVQLRNSDGGSIVEIFGGKHIALSTSAAGANIYVQANGAGSTVYLHSQGPLAINSATSITLTGPGGSITANGNTLG